MYFSNFRRKMISAPYFPCVPLSTSKKYAWRLFRTASLLLSKLKHFIGLKSFFFRQKIKTKSCWNIYLGELMLWHGTSRLCPNSSWFRSTIPQGAIPMLTNRPDLCWPSTSSASPTCFVTPDVWHGTWRLKNLDRQSFAINLLPVFVPPVNIHAPVVLAAFTNPFRRIYQMKNKKRKKRVKICSE